MNENALIKGLKDDLIAVLGTIIRYTSQTSKNANLAALKSGNYTAWSGGYK